MNTDRITVTVIILAIILLSIASCARTPTNYVGQVNGRPITIQEYNVAVRQQFERYMLDTGFTPDQEALRQLMDRAWRNIIEGIVFTQQLEEYGVTTTYREVIEHLKEKENIPELIKESRHFQTEDETFDLAKYHQSLTENEPIELDWLVQYYYDLQLPKLKLEEKLLSEIEFSRRQLEQEFFIENASAEASVIVFSPEDFQYISVSNPEIRSYYEQNRADYALEPFASLNYMIIELKPGSADSLKTKAVADSVYKELQQGIDFRMLAENISDGPTANRGGQLSFVEYDELPANVRNAARDLEEGEFTRPLRTNDGWVIYQIDTKTTNLVRLREIFIEHKVSEKTRSKEYDRIVGIRELALDLGLPLAGQETGNEVHSVKNLHPRRTRIPKLGESHSIVERAIDSESGTLFEPLYREDLKSYVLIEIEDSQSRGFKSLNRVSDEIREKIFRKKQKEQAYREAQRFHKDYRYRNIIANAKRQDYEVIDYDFFNLNSEVKNEEDTEPLVREVLAAGRSEFVTKPVELSNGSYIGVVRRFHKPDMNLFDDQIPALREKLIEKKRGTYYSRWIREKVDRARVRDWRDRL